MAYLITKSTDSIANLGSFNQRQLFRRELVIVDTAIKNYQQLVDDFFIQTPKDCTVEVVVLDSQQDGVNQISRALAKHQSVDAVHILSHGSDGGLRLGNTWFQLESLESYTGVFRSWRVTLSEQADLLFYACDLARGDPSQALIKDISTLTGADVAASIDVTGNGRFSGDWDLEYQCGQLETMVRFKASPPENWSGLLSTFTVTNTNTSGAGSLQQAILDANAMADLDTIDFNIGGGGLQTIVVGASWLGDLTNSVILDATTQPGYSGTPLIQLDGSGTGAGIDGFRFLTDNSTIKGFIVHSFGDEGLESDGSTGFGDNNIIQNNWVGIDATGAPQPNADHGILITVAARGNQVGGTGTNEGNVVAGNTSSGIVIRNLGTDNNVVEGNLIGVAPDGVTQVANGGYGIEILDTATNNLIGGVSAASRNIISGNTLDGIHINNSSNNTVSANWIGLDSTGSNGLGNGGDGIRITNGAINNDIGDPLSSVPNVISSNGGYGIIVLGATSLDNTIANNYVGLNATGTGSILNTDDGVYIAGTPSTTIGGMTASERNVIGAIFGKAAIDIAGTISSNTVVQGNYIGTDLSGTNRLTGSSFGISVSNAGNTTIGGTSINEANVVAGYSVTGISMFQPSAGSRIEGNFIGTDTSGTLDLTTGIFGITLQNSVGDVDVGGTAAGTGNTIAFHSQNGIKFFSNAGAGVSVNQNEIYSNNLLGIDLDGDGITANDTDDADTGANDLLNLPIITDVVQDGGDLDVTVDVDLPAGWYRIEFFENPNGNDETGHGEGEIYLGTDTINVTGAVGYETFNVTLSSVTPTQILGISATATEDTSGGAGTSFGSTSEFGPSYAGAGVLVVTTTNDALNGVVSSITTLLGDRGTDGELSFREAITAANNTVGTNTVGFNISVPLVGGAHTILVGNPGDGTNGALPAVTGAVMIDGTTDSDFVGTPIIELDGSVAGPGVDGLNLAAGSSGSTVKGLVINNFNEYGIRIQTNGFNLIAGNYIGTDVLGQVGEQNQSGGILIDGSDSNTIGGTNALLQNVISGNDPNGLRLINGSSSNSIQGNIIGLDVNGTNIIANTGVGILINNSPYNIVGGVLGGAGNLISGNDDEGVLITGISADGNKVLGNLIGTDGTGTYDLRNAGGGVHLFGGASENAIGGTNAGSLNVISGNLSHGVWLDGASTTNNQVQGNLIGTDITGTNGVGNTSSGVFIVNGANNNTVGGVVVESRNIISGNLGEAIIIDGSLSDDNIVRANYIGTDINGLNALGNLGNGVLIRNGSKNNIIGGTSALYRNIISANSDGIQLRDANTTGNFIQGNYIGTDKNGTIDLGNTDAGVDILLGASTNYIGGNSFATANIIAYSGTYGVVVEATGGVGNSIQRNSIFSNQELGIDLNEDNVSTNDLLDVDSGPNQLQNYPVLTLASTDGTNLTVVGSVHSSSGMTLTNEFFSSSVTDTSGHGEGEVFFGIERCFHRWKWRCLFYECFCSGGLSW